MPHTANNEAALVDGHTTAAEALVSPMAICSSDVVVSVDAEAIPSLEEAVSVVSEAVVPSLGADEANPSSMAVGIVVGKGDDVG